MIPNDGIPMSSYWIFVDDDAEASWMRVEQGPPKRCGDLEGA